MATPADESTRALRIGALALVLGIVALVLLDNRDDIADQFTSSYGVPVRLVTPSPRDKDRLEDAFAAVQSRSPVDASLQTATNSHFNSAEVRASSPAQAIEAGQAFARSLAASFDATGAGRLETEVGQRAYPVSDATSDMVRKLTMGGALLIGVLAVLLAWRVWRPLRTAHKLPPWAGIVLTVGLFLPVAPILMPGWLVAAAFAMMIPTSIAGVIVYKMEEVRRAARWPSVQGRILRSRLRAVDTKTSEGSRGRGNVPDIRYAFSVDGVDYRGKRVGIGEIMPDTPEVEAALERYQVGRTGPVFYNPDNPGEAVLDRDPPASPRTMYAIAAGVMLVGLAIVVAFTVLGDIVEWLQPHFPPRAFIPGFLFFLVCGLLSGAIMIANIAVAQRAARWPTTSGTVILNP
jgi:hypothetical protein